jgi:predicted NAD/FAD-dependent oxidoreductase
MIVAEFNDARSGGPFVCPRCLATIRISGPGAYICECPTLAAPLPPGSVVLTAEEANVQNAALEAARRVVYASSMRYRMKYEGRWDDFLPQHESLIALSGWLTELDALLAKEAADA